MSFKTDRLVDLFPDAYAAGDRASLLYKLLDALGAELMSADEAVKALLKSHWVDYAGGPALDGLGAIFSVARRRLAAGTDEPDEAFRSRLKSVVPLFTGGGTRRAVLGAVRSALGLPFDLDQLGLPAQFDALRRDIEALVTLDEFSPETARREGTLEPEPDPATHDFAELTLDVELPTVGSSLPAIRWTFLEGSARRLSVERIDSGTGFRSTESLVAGAPGSLLLSADEDARLVAVLDGADVSDRFRDLSTELPASMPEVPTTPSRWRFRATGAPFGEARFDGADAFDLPRFSVELSRVRFEPLTFTVTAPYFLQRAVEELRLRHRYPGELFVFEGLPLEAIQEVVDQTRAAGVRGSVQFSLNFFETHDLRAGEPAGGGFRMVGRRLAAEDHAAGESLIVANANRQREAHQVDEAFAVAAPFDVAAFDGSFGLA